MRRFLRNVLFTIVLVIIIALFGAFLVWLNVGYPKIGLIVLILIITSYVLYKIQKRMPNSWLNRLVKRIFDRVKEI